MSRPPLLLVHGALAASGQFAALAPRLAADFDVVAPDLDGHGGDGRDAPYDTAAFVRTALAALGDRGPAYVFGYSMGGWVALHLAREHPDRVAKVVTLATKLAWTPEVGGREAARLDPDVLAAKAPHVAAALDAAHPVAGWRAVVARTAAYLRTLGETAGPPEDLLRGVGCPVRLAVGDRDALVSIEETLAAYRAAPAGELAVLPGVAHPYERVPVETVESLLRTAFG